MLESGSWRLPDESPHEAVGAVRQAHQRDLAQHVHPSVRQNTRPAGAEAWATITASLAHEPVETPVLGVPQLPQIGHSARDQRPLQAASFIQGAHLAAPRIATLFSASHYAVGGGGERRAIEDRRVAGVQLALPAACQ